MIVALFLLMLAATLGGGAWLAVHHYRPLNNQINTDITRLRAADSFSVADYEWWRR